MYVYLGLVSLWKGKKWWLKYFKIWSDTCLRTLISKAILNYTIKSIFFQYEINTLLDYYVLLKNIETVIIQTLWSVSLFSKFVHSFFLFLDFLRPLWIHNTHTHIQKVALNRKTSSKRWFYWFMIYIYTNKTQIWYAEFNLKEVLIQIHYPKSESIIYLYYLFLNLFLHRALF